MEQLLTQAPAVLTLWFGSLFGDNPSWDVLLWTLLGVVTLVIGLWGRSRLGALLVAAYVSVVILVQSPIGGLLHGWLAIPATPWGEAGLLIGVVAMVFSVAQYALGDVLADEESGFVASVVVGAGMTGFLAMIWLQQLPPEVLSGFSPVTTGVLSSTLARALWPLAPLVLLGTTRD